MFYFLRETKEGIVQSEDVSETFYILNVKFDMVFPVITGNKTKLAV